MNTKNKNKELLEEYAEVFFNTDIETFLNQNTKRLAGCWWLTPTFLAVQEAEIRRIMVLSQHGQIVRETLSRNIPTQKRAGGVAQVVESLQSKHETLNSNTKD
jgi:hypothetical protein